MGAFTNTVESFNGLSDILVSIDDVINEVNKHNKDGQLDVIIREIEEFAKNETIFLNQFNDIYHFKKNTFENKEINAANIRDENGLYDLEKIKLIDNFSEDQRLHCMNIIYLEGENMINNGLPFFEDVELILRTRDVKVQFKPIYDSLYKIATFFNSI